MCCNHGSRYKQLNYLFLEIKLVMVYFLIIKTWSFYLLFSAFKLIGISRTIINYRGPKQTIINVKIGPREESSC